MVCHSKMVVGRSAQVGPVQEGRRDKQEILHHVGPQDTGEARLWMGQVCSRQQVTTAAGPVTVSNDLEYDAGLYL